MSGEKRSVADPSWEFTVGLVRGILIGTGIVQSRSCMGGRWARAGGEQGKTRGRPGESREEQWETRGRPGESVGEQWESSGRAGGDQGKTRGRAV